MYKYKIGLFLILFLLLVLLYLNNKEYFAGALTKENAEAVANISSMVNSGNLRVSNINATDNLKVDNNINMSGISITKSDVSPNATNIVYGDGTGWRINFKRGSDNQSIASIWDEKIIETDNFKANKGLIVNNGIFETGGDQDKVVIRPKKDNTDNSYWYFNKNGDHGYINGGNKWVITNNGQYVSNTSSFKIWPINRKDQNECLKVINDDTIALATCSNEPSQLWNWNSNQLVSLSNNKCLSATGNVSWGGAKNAQHTIGLRDCNSGDRTQNWSWYDNHRLRNMATATYLRAPNTAESNKNANYSYNNKVDFWDGGCGDDCQMWLG